MNIRARFHADLDRLSSDLITLGELSADAISSAQALLEQPDEAAAQRLIERDTEINRLRYEIEREVLLLIATQQPVAGDMRLVAAVLEIGGELERIGDYAKGIAAIGQRLDSPLSTGVLRLLQQMSTTAVAMLRGSLAAYQRHDAEAARRVVEDDDLVDALYRELFEHVMQWEGRDGDVIERANYVLWIAHNLERTADRVTNICERVIFTVTGDLVDLDPG